jgi:hypothetical protein
MRVLRFVDVGDNKACRFAAFLGIFVGMFVASWITDNAGLKLGNGANEWAMVLAKGFVGVGSILFCSWFFWKVVVKWYEYSDKRNLI